MEMTLDDVDGIVKGHFLCRQLFFYVRAAKQGTPAMETPQHYHFITAAGECQLLCVKSSGISVLHHFYGDYLLLIPSCQSVCGMIN